MVYRERLSKQETDWIRERVCARGEEFQDWAKFLGMKNYFFSKILSQVKPLPQKYEDKWEQMKQTLGEDKP